MIRTLAAALLFAAVAAPLSADAFTPGNVYLEDLSQAGGSTGYELWLHVGWQYATGTGYPLIDKVPPFTGPGHFIIPSSSQMLFEHERTVAFWNGEPLLFSDPAKGYTDIFTDDADLADIAPIRNGNFLVAERSADAARGAKVIQFNLSGVVAQYAFPKLLDPASGRALGASHIELLADQCTLLYTLGADDPAGGRVRRMDLCTQQAESDFAMVPAGAYAGSVRQLPNGDVIVADGSEVLRFDAHGVLIGTYAFPGVSHLALSTDGKTFYAAGVADGREEFRQYDASGNGKTIPLGNPEMQSIVVPLNVDDLVTVAEWRAAARPGRMRPVRHP